MLLLLSSLLLTNQSYADEAGDVVLSSIDDAANRFRDSLGRFTATTAEAGKSDRVMEFSAHTLGQKRMVEFFQPADMKGTKVLVIGPQQMYIYLPAYNKVRRIASHLTQQGSMGTTLSEADMATTHYGKVYEAEIKTEDENSWTLLCTAKAGVEAPYGKIEMTVSRAGSQISRLRYYNADGTHLKTEIRSDYSCNGDICQPMTLTMTDHTRNEMATTIVQTKWEIDTGVSEDSFSKRQLQRGR